MPVENSEISSSEELKIYTAEVAGDIDLAVGLVEGYGGRERHFEMCKEFAADQNLSTPPAKRLGTKKSPLA